MTPRIRTDRDRQQVAENALATIKWIVDSGPAQIRAAIDARIEDGIKAASYDEPSRGGSPSSERTLLRTDRQGNIISDRACEDLERFDHVMNLLCEADNIADPIRRHYPIWVPIEHAQPGEGPCPIGQCKRCWELRRAEARSEKWRDLCDVCGRWKADHGEKMPEPLWDLRVRQGKARITTADLKKHAPHLLPKEQAS